MGSTYTIPTCNCLHYNVHSWFLALCYINSHLFFRQELSSSLHESWEQSTFDHPFYLSLNLFHYYSVFPELRELGTTNSFQDVVKSWIYTAAQGCFVLCSFSNLSIQLVFLNSIKHWSEIFTETYCNSKILLLHSTSQLGAHHFIFEVRIFFPTVHHFYLSKM